MVPGAHVFLVSVAPFTAVRLCVFALSVVRGGRGGGGAHWGVGQLADRPAVNREVGGSSPPAPVAFRRDIRPSSLEGGRVMEREGRWTRRDFVRAGSVAGATVLLGSY